MINVQGVHSGHGEVDGEKHLGMALVHDVSDAQQLAVE